MTVVRRTIYRRINPNRSIGGVADGYLVERYKGVLAGRITPLGYIPTDKEDFAEMLYENNNLTPSGSWSETKVEGLQKIRCVISSDFSQD